MCPLCVYSSDVRYQLPIPVHDRFTGWKVILGLLGSFTAKKLLVIVNYCKIHIEAEKSLFYTFSAFFILETVFTYKIKFYVCRIHYLRAF